jgi:hypothetical protein
MRLSFQKSCDKPPQWPLRSADVHQELDRVLRDASTALLPPWLATLFDRTLGISVPNTLAHNYIWATRGSWILTDPFDLAIVRCAEIELHPDATLFTEVVALMHPDCHTPPPRNKTAWEPPDRTKTPWDLPQPTLTTRQQEPTNVLRSYSNPDRCMRIHDRWVFIQRGSGAPDAGLRIALDDRDGIIAIRTSRRPVELLAVLAPIGRNFYGGGIARISLALDYCPYGAETAAEANSELRFRSPLQSLTDSMELHHQAEADQMPEDGLITARHIDGVRFTTEGRVRWRESDYGHYFQSATQLFAFFSLDHVYLIAPTRGVRGRRAFGLPEPWRISHYLLKDAVKRSLSELGETGTRDDAIQALHAALQTTQGPFTHFSWAAV